MEPKTQLMKDISPCRVIDKPLLIYLWPTVINLDIRVIASPCESFGLSIECIASDRGEAVKNLCMWINTSDCCPKLSVFLLLANDLELNEDAWQTDNEDSEIRFTTWYAKENPLPFSDICNEQN
ncbi:hypothetical protein T265_11857 [Opisthorchis viverrini]|uniref:Uncharacterized protein n=1 Tax=Opisthorchis viverrini TaxID=6198 RepID=A0A074ZVX2_OPIVI|nr:hypothetical protein T265_11857 [Opisthorchis viverrini]KER19334.1 hypothetical protein T265_11857 [Opisthorchis viverrini]